MSKIKNVLDSPLWVGLALLLLLGAVVAIPVKVANDNAAENEQVSKQRTGAACHRGNPSRAYLQLRARVVHGGPSRDAHLIYHVLNCKATVARDGQPVPLTKRSETAYLREFQHRRIAIMDGNRMIGTVPFDVYFAGKGPRQH